MKKTTEAAAKKTLTKKQIKALKPAAATKKAAAKKPAMVAAGLATDFSASAPATKKAAKPAKAAKAPKPAKPAPAAKPAKANGKGATILALIQREGGATATELQQATGWQAHSVRGFLSTANKRGTKIASTKREDGQRVYSA